MPEFKEEIHTYKVSYMPPGENKLKDKEVQGNSVAQVMHIINKEFNKQVVKGVLYLRKETIPRRY